MQQGQGVAGIAGWFPVTPRGESRLPFDLIFHAETFAFDDHSLGVMQQTIQDGGREGAVIKWLIRNPSKIHWSSVKCKWMVDVRPPAGACHTSCRPLVLTAASVSNAVAPQTCAVRHCQKRARGVYAGA